MFYEVFVYSFYYPDQQMYNIYKYMYINNILYIVRTHSYKFRCIRIIFRESYPPTLTKL